MVKLTSGKIYVASGKKIMSADEVTNIETSAIGKSIATKIMEKHNSGQGDDYKIKFDALCSHDITYVGIVQTARASGLEKFPVPYVLTNCHNSLCAVGGTINEDDHIFGLTAAKKYGGIFVPPHVAVIHQYMREMVAGGEKMILGSDSHTRYGALGTMAVGEGGPELVKQILSRTYDIKKPDVVAVILTGEVQKGVGPQDVALAIIGETFKNGFVKNKVMEFMGEGAKKLSMEFRIGIDVMTTETTCLSSIWETDEKTREYLADFGRESEYKHLTEEDIVEFDGAIEVDLSQVKPMIAMPFHPSNVFTIEDVCKNPYDILKEVEEKALEQTENKKLTLNLLSKIQDGKVYVDQGVIAGCAGGTFENIVEASQILQGDSIGFDKYSLQVYPSSQAVYQELVKNGTISSLMSSGAIVKTAFCGPCFGAGDVPSHQSFSIRHTTRNFPQREGSKPASNQIASVALMDARSIAATSKNQGYLTPATEIDYESKPAKFYFDKAVYQSRIFQGYEKAKEEESLVLGPNITDWPEQVALSKAVLMKAAAVITDEVTTTDELIPSGDTSSYRSNPQMLATFTLSRKDPKYVGRAKEIFECEKQRRNGEVAEDFKKAMDAVSRTDAENFNFGSFIFANKPGDGSAREQAASCQRVLGGVANIACEYATKRYRSNLMNWGMLPLIIKENAFEIGDFVYIDNIDELVASGAYEVPAKLIRDGKASDITLYIDNMSSEERKIVLAGCLMNHYAKENK
ncbi:MAG: hydratase [Bacillota bacterium]